MVDKILEGAVGAELLLIDAFAGTDLLAGATAALLGSANAISSSSILGRRPEQRQTQMATSYRWGGQTQQPRISQNIFANRAEQAYQSIVSAADQINSLQRTAELNPTPIRTDLGIQNVAQVVNTGILQEEEKIEENEEEKLEFQAVSPIAGFEFQRDASDAATIDTHRMYQLTHFMDINGRSVPYDYQDPNSWPLYFWRVANDVFTHLGDGDFRYEMQISALSQQYIKRRDTRRVQRGNEVTGRGAGRDWRSKRVDTVIQNELNDPVLIRLIMAMAIQNQRFFNMTPTEMARVLIDGIDQINNGNIEEISGYRITDADITILNGFREQLVTLEQTYAQRSEIEEPLTPLIQQPITSDQFFETMSLLTFFRDHFHTILRSAVSLTREYIETGDRTNSDIFQFFRQQLRKVLHQEYNKQRRYQIDWFEDFETAPTLDPFEDTKEEKKERSRRDRMQVMESNISTFGQRAVERQRLPHLSTNYPIQSVQQSLMFQANDSPEPTLTPETLERWEKYFINPRARQQFQAAIRKVGNYDAQRRGQIQAGLFQDTDADLDRQLSLSAQLTRITKVSQLIEEEQARSQEEIQDTGRVDQSGLFDVPLVRDEHLLDEIEPLSMDWANVSNPITRNLLRRQAEERQQNRRMNPSRIKERATIAVRDLLNRSRDIISGIPSIFIVPNPRGEYSSVPVDDFPEEGSQIAYRHPALRIDDFNQEEAQNILIDQQLREFDSSMLFLNWVLNQQNNFVPVEQLLGGQSVVIIPQQQPINPPDVQPMVVINEQPVNPEILRPDEGNIRDPDVQVVEEPEVQIDSQNPTAQERIYIKRRQPRPSGNSVPFQRIPEENEYAEEQRPRKRIDVRKKRQQKKQDDF